MLRLSSVLAGLAVLAAGCDSGSQGSQLAFEDQALLSPAAGITAIDADGTVTQTDPGDWQIGPVFASDIRFAFLPSPNPARRSDLIAFQLVAAFSTPLPGLTVQIRTVDPRTDVPRLSPLFGTGCEAGSLSCSFTVRASQIEDLNGPGVARLVVGNGRSIVTYGDIEIR